MKKFRKLLSLVLTVIMVFAMAAPTFADDTYTLTIDNGSTSHSYIAYQIFKGTLYNTAAEGAMPVYGLTNIEWGDDVADSDALLSALKVNEAFANCVDASTVADVLVGFNDNSDQIKDFADLVGESSDNGFLYLGTSNKISSIPEGEEKHQISGLSAGYYLVMDVYQENVTVESYSDFMLKIVGNVEVTPKEDDIPQADKEIGTQPATEGSEVTSGDYNIGDTIDYVLTAKLPDATTFAEYETYYLKFKDELSDGLEYVEGSLHVYLNSVADSNEITTSADEIVYPNETSNILTIEYENIKSNSNINGGDTIIVTYQAELTTDALVGADGNDNTLTLEYSNNPNGTQHGTTTPEKVKVYTYELSIYKYTGEGEEARPLSGAEFAIYRGEWNEVPELNTKEYAVIDAAGKVTGWVKATAENAVPDGAGKVTSGTDGYVSIEGLDAGTYWLEETVAPEGFNKLDGPKEIVIEAVTSETEIVSLTIQVDDGVAVDGETVIVDEEEEFTGKVTIDVPNKAGTLLPSTGGIGTTIFYAAGIILMAGAVFFVVRRKRA